MLGLEDLAHAAGPDFVEDRVLAKDERPGFAPFDLLTLERRQIVALHKCLDELLNGLRIGLGRDEGFELAGGNDARVGKLLDDLFKREGHRRISGVRKRDSRLYCPLMER